ncbi:hypothetical protein E3N88_13164 [Mikania micrantha]|uniref:1,3-beta-glucan synthase n=1 Tax=Mikania micrantha TaxID=192012 RepID=A0A5N6P7T6_9ASTR|nr:hypothetical protein E3N88_13164 [Mikania micrantha]
MLFMMRMMRLKKILECWMAIVHGPTGEQADVDGPVIEQWLVLQLVRGLPTEFDVVGANLNQTLPSWGIACNMLLREVQRQSTLDSLTNTSLAVAAIAQHPPNLSPTPASPSFNPSTPEDPQAHLTELNPLEPTDLAATFLPMTMEAPDINWKFTTDNYVSVTFDSFGFSVKYYKTWMLLSRHNNTDPLYLFNTTVSPPASTFFATSNSSTWHGRLGHPGSYIMDFLPFDLLHCYLWTSPILRKTGYKYNMIPVALDIATNSHGFAHELKKRMENDKYMSCAVRECYASFRCIIRFLVQGERERKIIYNIFSEIDAHIEGGSLVAAFNMSAFPTLYGHIVEFIKCLDMLEVILRDMMVNELTILHEPPYVELGQQYNQLFAPAGAILFPAPSSEAWKERINRLYLLLTVRDSAMYIPSNIEARRRLSFFSNSLFMNMPSAPKVRNMLSFSILTPYYSEDVLFPLDLLEKQNEDGISMISYLQKIFSDEWTNFLERKRCYSINDLVGNGDLKDDLCHWASYRGQTLARTVRGMMYYRQALELQCFLDVAEDEDLMEGFKSTELRESSLLAQCQAVADMKFTYVVSCQHYGIQKQSGDPRAQDVLKLLSKYPSLRVACIDEVEENSKDANNRMRINKVYYSTLVKAVPSSSETGQIWDQVTQIWSQTLDMQVIYRIKLPGPAKLGEGGPENQNHAIIFTRGEGLQTIDMNQDNYMEEAFKMRNLLQEFLKTHDDGKFPTILGVREHIFTEKYAISCTVFLFLFFFFVFERVLFSCYSVSSLAHFMSNQETSFVTIGRRLMANPLKVRFHYGHPDVFDRLFHITRGGFNSTLRDGKVTHHDYVQVGKGWDASLNQISLFEAKMAGGNGEQTLSRDLYRLGHNFDFFRMLSCYFTTTGFYFNTLIAVFIVYVFLYGRLYLVLSGHEELQNQPAILNNQSLQVVFASQSFVQIGFLVALPMMMEIGLERGFLTALSEFIIMLINLAPMFFTFLLGTKSHYYGRTLLHGGAKYTTTGRGFVVFHTKFTDNYRFYSRSHFVKGIELLNLLIVNQIFGKSFKGVLTHFLITVSIWFLVITWLFAPFVFNPLGFEWQKIVDDWADWNKWISNQGGIGVPLENSWESWWEEEQEHLSYSGKRAVILEILLAFRFLIYHFWLVYRSDMSKHGMSALAVFYMTLQDIVVCFLAFVSTGWGLLLIAQACRPVVKMAGLWESVRAVARGYEIVMGLIVFTPVALIARLPFVSDIIKLGSMAYGYRLWEDAIELNSSVYILDHCNNLQDLDQTSIDKNDFDSYLD